MKELLKLIDSETKVLSIDNYTYEVHPKNNDNINYANTNVNFQTGPIKENGVNGCQNEDLLLIVIDRLQTFQKGDFVCRENAIALTKIEEALLWLNKRTLDRRIRNVEGTNIK